MENGPDNLTSILIKHTSYCTISLITKQIKNTTIPNKIKKFIGNYIYGHQGYTTLFIPRPLGAQVFWAPMRDTVHESSKAAALAGFNQREAGSNAVGTWGQLR